MIGAYSVMDWEVHVHREIEYIYSVKPLVLIF